MARADLDGAFFGSSLPHLLLMKYPDLWPEEPLVPYVPRVYGFRVVEDPAVKRDKRKAADGSARSSQAVHEQTTKKKGSMATGTSKEEVPKVMIDVKRGAANGEKHEAVPMQAQ